MSLRGMRVGVTGGAGFIGYHLIGALLDKGAVVHVLDRYQTHHAGVTSHIGDVRDPAAFEIFDSCQVVFNLAAESNVMRAESDPEFAMKSSILGAENLLPFIQRGGFVVHASSREVYGQPSYTPVDEQHPLQPKNVYGKSKYQADIILQPYAAVLRLANVIGTHDGNHTRIVPNWLMKASSGEPLPVYGGSQTIDFVPVQTVVRAMLVAAARRTPMVVNIGSGVQISLTQLADRVQQLYPTAKFEFHPPRGAEVTAFLADTTRMEHLLGVNPPGRPLDGLAEIAEYYEYVVETQQRVAS